MDLDHRGPDDKDTLYQKAEEMLKERSINMPDTFDGLSIEESKQLLHELLLQQAELEIQNEELRRTQFELEESRSRYFDLYDLAPVGYITLDEWGLIRETNLTAAKLLSLEKKELIGEPLNTFLAREDQERYYQHYKEALKTQGQKSLELRLPQRKTLTPWVHLKISMVKSHESSAPICRIILVDITRQKQAEEMLKKTHLYLEERVRERTHELELANSKLKTEITKHNRALRLLKDSEEHFRKIVEIMPIAVFGHTHKGILFTNTAAAELMEVEDSQELVGKELVEFLPHNQRERFSACLQRALTQPVENESLMVKVASITGKYIDVEMFFTPSLYQETRVVHITAHNITRRRKIEEEIKKADKLESIGLLAGGIAHDFNNYLATMLGNINLAKLYSNNDKVQDKLKNMERATMMGKELSNQLFTFAKGGRPLKEKASIKELIVDDIKFTLSGSNILPVFYIAEDLYMVEVDRGQLSQVLNNLTINAIQAMPEGGVLTVKAENRRIKETEEDLFIPLTPGPYVMISIQDEGTGIPEKYLTKVFDPFFTTKNKGRGLGLATSYSIMKNHNGQLYVESEMGVGTTFTIFLPAIMENEVEQGVSSTLFKGTEKILLMDDEEDLLSVIGESLTTLGYNVTLARDGKEATDSYMQALEQEEPFDLVIMDLTIPGEKGGQQIINELIKEDPTVKAIVASGYSNDPIMANYQEYGFKGALKKPFTMERLTKTIYEILKESE